MSLGYLITLTLLIGVSTEVIFKDDSLVVFKDDCDALAEQLHLYRLEADVYPTHLFYYSEFVPYGTGEDDSFLTREEFRKHLHQKYAQCCRSDAYEVEANE